MTTIDEFVDHFDREFRTLDGVYDRADDRAWTYADQRLKGVWQWMAHVLETIEFYLADKSEGFPWGHRFGLDSGRKPRSSRCRTRKRCAPTRGMWSSCSIVCWMARQTGIWRPTKLSTLGPAKPTWASCCT